MACSSRRMCPAVAMVEDGGRKDRGERESSLESSRDPLSGDTSRSDNLWECHNLRMAVLGVKGHLSLLFSSFSNQDVLGEPQKLHLEQAPEAWH